MKHLIPLLSLAIVSSVAVVGCTTNTGVAKSETAKPVAVAAKERVRISAVGYGTESLYEAYTPGQRRLMAIRASKLDAYRSLAEQINGVKIEGNTTVGAMAVKSDSFRAKVNALVRGARVTSVTPMADNNYETVIEVFVDREFFDNYLSYSDQAANSPTKSSCGTNCFDPDDLAPR
ncbi:MAG: LPP20 family lipoprotein [Thiotrichales bacterium]|jgi:hypothetical protein|nr:LPP20 family lipoprotein [Thiotrichales bacterium]